MKAKGWIALRLGLNLAMLGLAGIAHAQAGAGPATPARKDRGLLAVLPEGQGRVFSDRANGTVVAKAGGKGVSLRDGDIVKFIEDNSGIGMGEDTFAEVILNGKKLTVPNQHLILEKRLERSPDGQWAVFSTYTSCVDFCYATGWLLGPAVRIRLSEHEFGPDLVVAWRKDGKQVAVGSRGLYLVSLPDGKVTDAREFTAPAYSPDGRLFVRGNGESDDAVYEWIPEGKPRKILAFRGSPPPMETDTDPGDPMPVTFARNGALTADFNRNLKSRLRTVAAADIGKNLDGTSTPRPATLDKVLSLIEDPNSPPAAASAAALSECERSPAFAHELAVAANTRGYRLYQEGKLDEAIPLFDAAVSLDGKYGMPRYNLARIHALKGNAQESVVYLRMLRIMGKGQRARLEQARKDDAFKKIADSPEFRAIFQ
jgi:hypothetical protein